MPTAKVPPDCADNKGSAGAVSGKLNQPLLRTYVHTCYTHVHTSVHVHIYIHGYTQDLPSIAAQDSYTAVQDLLGGLLDMQFNRNDSLLDNEAPPPKLLADCTETCTDCCADCLLPVGPIISPTVAQTIAQTVAQTVAQAAATDRSH